jgi:DNA modification methylase
MTRATAVNKGLAFNHTFEQTGNSQIILADCFEWLRQVPENTLHAIVTDPPPGSILLYFLRSVE